MLHSQAEAASAEDLYKTSPTNWGAALEGYSNFTCWSCCFDECCKIGPIFATTRLPRFQKPCVIICMKKLNEIIVVQISSA